MAREIDAINSLLLAVGTEIVENINEPDAQLAKRTLDRVIAELPYSTLDFAMSYEAFPSDIYTYIVAKGARRFQALMVSSETLYGFTAEDEFNAKRALIQKKVIPQAFKNEIAQKLGELLGYADSVPQAIKDDLALLKLQAMLFGNPEEYPLSIEVVNASYLDFKKRLIAKRECPTEILEATRDRLFADYGFSHAINIGGEFVKSIACYEFQKSILGVDDYVITPEERARFEVDFRQALILNRCCPPLLRDKVLQEFVNTYGITPSEHGSLIDDYILNKALYRLQASIVSDPNARAITNEDIDNAEASLIANLIAPKAIYARAIHETLLELNIEPSYPMNELPKEVINYAKTKAAYIHQPTAIRDPAKYIIDERGLIRAKALALQSLPKLSMLDNQAVFKNTTRSLTPNATVAAKTEYYRLKTIGGN